MGLSFSRSTWIGSSELATEPRNLAEEPRGTYLELADNLLAKIFGAYVGAEGNEEASIDVLLLQASFPFLSAENSLLFKLPGLTLLSSFSPFVRRVL